MTCVYYVEMAYNKNTFEKENVEVKNHQKKTIFDSSINKESHLQQINAQFKLHEAFKG